VNSGNEAFMMLFALQMLLDPAGTRVPTVKKEKGMANVNMMQAMNTMGPKAMARGIPAMPVLMQGMPVMSMYAMPGMPMIPGAAGMPMVAVNGGMGPMAAPPGSPRLAPKNSNLQVRADSGSGKVLRVSSAYDLSGEFGQMQMSVKRVQSTDSPMASVNGGSRPTFAGQQQSLNGKSTAAGAHGVVSGSLKERKASFLELEKRQKKDNTYGSLLR
jgi:hypothetical protein